MESLGLVLGDLIVQLLNLLLLVGWPLLAILAIFQLRRQELTDFARVIWAVVILLLPIVGALTFWIVRPGKHA